MQELACGHHATVPLEFALWRAESGLCLLCTLKRELQLQGAFLHPGATSLTGGLVPAPSDSVWEHWATQGPQYYVMAQLIWDPRRDGQAILDDYYARGFGPAADHVRAYYDLLEQARMAYVDEHGYETEPLSFPQLYSDDLLDRAGNHLEQARAGIPDETGVYGARVEFVAAGLAFTRLSVENMSLMQAYWTDPDEAVAQRVRENWQRMERLCADHPYVVNWGPVRPTTPRMLGLHPDHPNPRWRFRAREKQKPREADDLDQN